MESPSPSFRLVDVRWATTLAPLQMIARRCGDHIPAQKAALAVPDASFAAFRRGLRRLGYVLPERSLAIKGRKATGRKTGD